MAEIEKNATKSETQRLSIETMTRRFETLTPVEAAINLRVREWSRDCAARKLQHPHFSANADGTEVC